MVHRTIAVAGLLLVLAVGLHAGCSDDTESEPTTTTGSTTDTTTTGSGGAAAGGASGGSSSGGGGGAAHRIAVRVVSGEGEFYDVATGETFTPSGNNYAHVEDGHATFAVSGSGGSYSYDPTHADTQLSAMSALGYNTVRVFLEGTRLNNDAYPSDGTEDRFDVEYVANVADFLRRAQAHGLYVYITLPRHLPTNYTAGLGTHDDVDGVNQYYMRQSFIDVRKELIEDIITELQEEAAPLEIVFAWGAINEYQLNRGNRPLSIDCSNPNPECDVTVTTGSYDLTVPAQREAMINETATHYLDEVRQAVKALEPEALVSAGFSPVGFVNAGVSHHVPTLAGAEASQLDIIELHVSPHHMAPYAPPYPPFDFASVLAEYEISTDRSRPRILGEDGARKSIDNQDIYQDAQDAATVIADWRRQSCTFGFDGWLLWRWEGEYFTGAPTGWWTAVESGGVIGDALAPVNVPDPCIP